MRSKSSFLTMITGIISMVIIGVLGFIKIRYFIDGLGSDANGLIQMIYRILSYLSLAELGLGGALIYKLYKPLAEKDERQISKIINTATHFFNRIGLGVMGFLVTFMLVIPFIIKNNSYDNLYLYILFLLAGIPYAVEYIWYKKYYILIAADQKQYINNIIFNTSSILYNIFIILALMKGINLIQYILISYPFILINGIALQIIYKKNYGFVKKSKEIDKEAVKMSKDVFVHNIGSSINSSSDQIVLSIFNGLTFVSIYSSYYYIVKYLKDIANSILKSTLYSFGNLFSDKEQINTKGYKVFLEYSSFSSYFAIVISSMFFISIVPFINIWINNPKYVLGFGGVLAFTMLVYSNIITIPVSVASSATGIFKETKYYSFIATFVNISLSLLLIKKYEIAGIVFATDISMLLFYTPLISKTLYKGIFTEHKQRDYYFKIFESMIIIAGIIGISYLINISNIYNGHIVNWITVSLICFVLILLIVGVFYYFTDKSFKEFVYRCLYLIKRRKKSE